MMSGIKQVRQIMNSEPIRSRVVAEEVPGPDVQSDDEIFRFMEETGNTAQHTAETCKMGKDPMAVVDERLRVRGIERLRVVDASVMSKLTSGNTNAPAIMIGVKGGRYDLQGCGTAPGILRRTNNGRNRPPLKIRLDQRQEGDHIEHFRKL
ncbi:L-sorbose dehydrogenase [Brucella inopinata]|nr:L-sorbose dehydrogenase [Brucella inopinata]